jgi:hypothetical protein
MFLFGNISAAEIDVGNKKTPQRIKMTTNRFILQHSNNYLVPDREMSPFAVISSPYSHSKGAKLLKNLAQDRPGKALQKAQDELCEKSSELKY